MDDSTIIELFFDRSEQAIRELDSKYGKVCHNLSYNILHSRQDAEECVNDAYLGAWNTIPPTRPNPLLAFLCRIVRNLSLMRYHADGQPSVAAEATPWRWRNWRAVWPRPAQWRETWKNRSLFS